MSYVTINFSLAILVLVRFLCTFYAEYFRCYYFSSFTCICRLTAVVEVVDTVVFVVVVVVNADDAVSSSLLNIELKLVSL